MQIVAYLDICLFILFQALFWGNTAHSCLTGLLVIGVPAHCTAVGGFTSYLTWDYGVFSSTASRLVVSHSVVASGKVGLNLNVFGPNPVAHLLGRKWVKLENSLIVGITAGEVCLSSSPPHAVPGVSFSHMDHKHGIMMSSFNQKRSKMSGTGPFHLSALLSYFFIHVCAHVYVCVCYITFRMDARIHFLCPSLEVI